MTQSNIPLLITFDGEARSGKGTIVHRTQSSLRDNGFTVLTIDRGQLFRGIAAMAHKQNVDCDSPAAVEQFLQQENVLDEVLDLLRTVPTLSDDERDALLYTARIGEDSAKIGACPLSQSLAIDLLRQRIVRAGREQIDVVLVDGRALEKLARDIDSDKLAHYLLGFYFICDAQVGARRTLKLYDRNYDDLKPEEKQQVDALVQQIKQRNRADRERSTEPLVRPSIAPTILPAGPPLDQQLHLIDTSSNISKEAMSKPIVDYIVQAVQKN